MSNRIVFGFMSALSVRGQDTSRIREDLLQLTDASGPRNVGSPGLERARIWLEQRLREYGLESIRREENQPIGIAEGVTWDPIGWFASRLTVQQRAPYQATLIGVPVL